MPDLPGLCFQDWPLEWLTLLWCTSNPFEYSDFWQTCSYSRLPTGQIFLVSHIFNHFVHFEDQLLGNDMWKKIESLPTQFLTILICIYKCKLLVLFFSPNTTDVQIHYHKAILLLQNIVQKVIPKALLKNNDCCAFSCDHVWRRSWFCLVAMTIIQITHFDF